MEQYKKFGLGAVIAGGVMLPTLARAEFTITPPTFDMTALGTYTGVILMALSGLWLARKFIKMTNKS